MAYSWGIYVLFIYQRRKYNGKQTEIVVIKSTLVNYMFTHYNRDMTEGSCYGKTFDELQIKDDFMFSVIMRNPKFCNGPKRSWTGTEIV